MSVFRKTESKRLKCIGFVVPLAAARLASQLSYQPTFRGFQATSYSGLMAILTRLMQFLTIFARKAALSTGFCV